MSENGSAMQNVVVQGLGFVGSAMAVAAAASMDRHGKPFFTVTGIDLDTEPGRSRKEKLNAGVFPFETTDLKLISATREAAARGNLRASTDSEAMETADVILVSVNLDVSDAGGENPHVDFTGFRRALLTIGEHVREEALVIIETTVPPGTCSMIVRPLLAEQMNKRGLNPDSVHIAHSYERVMPGADYLDSIVNFWRVYSGITDKAADLCADFLSKIIDVEKYPLTKLDSTVASETAKVLENSYRAVNIAFMEEWGRFAEATGTDLFQVIDAIRVRPTHSNIRQPGFGVGGYCLTKDPLFAGIAARDLLSLQGHTFPFCRMAVEANRKMPLVTLEKLRNYFDGSLEGVSILLLGISYRQDVGDTRHSPAEVFAKAALEEGAVITPHDPFLEYWDEMGMKVFRSIPESEEFDVLLFCVPHGIYRKIDFAGWADGGKFRLVFDANNVLSAQQRKCIQQMGLPLVCIGRG